jgi:hypothetical protein
MYAPGYDLAVVDAKTRLPISGAAIEVASSYKDAMHLASAVTDAEGHARTQPAIRRVWLPLMLDPYIPPATLTLSAKGYATRHVDSSDSSLRSKECAQDPNCEPPYPDIRSMGVIALDPQN